jgi:hypothetical protein
MDKVYLLLMRDGFLEMFLLIRDRLVYLLIRDRLLEVYLLITGSFWRYTS